MISKPVAIFFLSAALATTFAADCIADESSAPKCEAKPVETEHVDIKVPNDGPFKGQWIVVLRGEKIEFIPASGRSEIDGTVVTAATEKLHMGDLKAAIAIGDDNTVISTKLKKAREPFSRN